MQYNTDNSIKIDISRILSTPTPFKVSIQKLYFFKKKRHFSIQKFPYRMLEHKRKTFHYYKFNPTLLSNFQHIHGGKGGTEISNQNPEKIIKKLFRRLFTEAYNSNNIPPTHPNKIPGISPQCHHFKIPISHCPTFVFELFYYYYFLPFFSILARFSHTVVVRWFY